MPSFVDSILQKLFPKEEEAVSVSGPIKWSEVLDEKYNAWLPEGTKVLQAIQSDISRQRVIESTELNLQWYRDRAANGMVAELRSLSNQLTDLRLFGQLLTERLKTLQYRLYTAEQKSKEAGDSVEHQLWYYLKPAPVVEEGQTQHNQKYGNIKIELIQKDEEIQLKFLCTVYSGRNYTDPLPFDDLLKAVFDAD